MLSHHSVLKSNFTAGFLIRLGRSYRGLNCLEVLKRLAADYEVFEVLMMTLLSC